ncbi:MAG: hypothetical protein IJ523_07255 [Succinivibrionaceae bacterium]|nr:hypothetical protein [Succinivibrionaceae bacterium]
MFIIKTVNNPTPIISNDVKDVQDIVLGLTNDDKVALDAYCAVCTMGFNNSFNQSDINITCVPDGGAIL